MLFRSDKTKVVTHSSVSKGFPKPNIGSPISIQKKQNFVEANLGKKKEKIMSTNKFASTTLIPHFSGTSSPARTLTNLATSHAASTEIQKRIDKLEKNNIKINPEDLARDTKNILIRMPPYKKNDLENFSSAETDTTFFRILNKCIFTEGLVDKWKAAS